MMFHIHGAGDVEDTRGDGERQCEYGKDGEQPARKYSVFLTSYEQSG